MSEITHLETENAELKAENDKLREELYKWERLTVGIDLPEHPVTQFKPKDLERENAKLREQGARLFDKTLEIGTENAKLRELVQDIYGVMWAVSERCWYEDRMRELGIEVE